MLVLHAAAGCGPTGDANEDEALGKHEPNEYDLWTAECVSSSVPGLQGRELAKQGPKIIDYIDPIAAGHTLLVAPGLAEFEANDEWPFDVTLPFAFPYWVSNTTISSTTVIGFSPNGALRMGGGDTTCGLQTPLWKYPGKNRVDRTPTIHAHGADGYAGNMHSFADQTQAVFTYTNMNYCCPHYPGGGPGGWSTQVVLLPNGDFQIRQVQATSDTSRKIAIGYSDGLYAKNSKENATDMHWNKVPIGKPRALGMVDFGSSKPGGMATGVVLYFQYDSVNGYTVTRLQ
jgi:hypothetical protein